MDKTYAEQQGQPTFDWARAIQKALIEEPNITEHHRMTRLAFNWVSCACGTQCAIIPRASKDRLGRPEGSPIDDCLFDLGIHFNRAVRGREWEDAQATLDKIEARSDILIKRELAKQQKA